MTLSPRDDEPDDHVSRAGASDDPSEAPDGAVAGDAGPPDGPAGSVGDQVVGGVDDGQDDEASRLAAEAAAWEAIVAHYGDAPTWEEPRGLPHPDHPAGRGRLRATPPPAPDPAARSHDGPFADPHDEPDVAKGPEERFVPPPPPPLPRTSPARALAWFGLLGVPAVVLVLLVVQVSLPTWVAVGFTAWFVGGFVFLVAGMRTGADDDPDGGAVV